MVDVKKIDAFFEHAQPFKTHRKAHQSKRERYYKILKLLMPSVAAVLISLILIFPHLKKNNFVSQYDLTAPKMGELEKLHVEKTSFSMTDIDGKISTFTAELMEETAPSSKVVRLTRPKGKIALDQDKYADISADTGYYDQNGNIVTAQNNVLAVYDNDTTIETSAAEYDFSKNYGKGDAAVYAFGSWGKLWADAFAFDKTSEILYLKGKSKVEHLENTLTSTDEMRYNKPKNKLEAFGNVVLRRPDMTLYADKAVLFLEDLKNNTIKQIEAFGNVVVISNEATAKGAYGLYKPSSDLLELSGHVEIQKDGHLIYGDKAVFNTKTSVAKMLSYSKNNRVTGVIRGAQIKGKK